MSSAMQGSKKPSTLEKLIIFLDEKANVTTWGIQSASGWQRGEIALTPEIGHKRTVIALVAATQVLLTQTDKIHATQRQHLLKAVPYALEDSLAEDVESLHFVVGTQSKDHPLAVAVVAKSMMNRWLEALKSYGLEPHQMIPDLLALPFDPQADEWTVLINPTHWMIRTDIQSGFTTDADNGFIMLQSFLKHSHHPPKQIRLWSILPVETTTSDILSHLTHSCGDGTTLFFDFPVAVQEKAFLLGHPIEQPPPFNLLSGAYATQKEARQLWLHWKTTVFLALFALLLFAGNLVWESYDLLTKQRKISAEIEQLFRKSFPDIHKVVNPKAQMERQLQLLENNTSSGGEIFLSMLAKVAKPLSEQPNLELRGLRYQSEELELELWIPTLENLDQLKQKIMKLDLYTVEILSATTKENRVEVQLRLKKKINVAK